MEKIEDKLSKIIQYSKSTLEKDEKTIEKLKSLVLDIVQELHSIDSSKDKTKKELEIILELQSK